MAIAATKNGSSQGSTPTFDADPSLETFKREFVAKHGRLVVEPSDGAAYREAIEALIELGGTEPDLKAPPRRRFD